MGAAAHRSFAIHACVGLSGALALLATACGSADSGDDQGSTTDSPPASGCAHGELPDDSGGCLAAGVPSALCGVGFEPDGDVGCTPVLPADACGPGLMALPGETACREIMPCGRGRWGDVVEDADTQFVDGAFEGASDGSAAAPWRTIQEGVDAAAPGATVAVASGVYEEDVVIEDKAVRVHGRCPAMVEVQGVARAFLVGAGASKTELSGLSCTGEIGVSVSGSHDVWLDRMHVHDTTVRGVNIVDLLGPTSALVTGSLIEDCATVGAFLGGAHVRVERSVIRDAVPDAVGDAHGIEVQLDVETMVPATVEIRECLLERNVEAGIAVFGSKATVESTVVRGTVANVATQEGGFGIAAWTDQDVFVPSEVRVASSVVSDNTTVGIIAMGSHLDVEGVVVRGTKLQPSDGWSGNGILLQQDLDTEAPSTARVRSSLLADNHEVGIAILGSEADIEAVVVRDTKGRGDELMGRGVQAQEGYATHRRARMSLLGSVVERSVEVGVFVVSSDAILDGVLVRDVAPNTVSMLFGDGVGVYATGPPAHASLSRVRVERASRAGVASFGGTAELRSVELECNSIDLDAETTGGVAAVFDDRGGNVCGCAGVSEPCTAVSSSLGPPGPLGN
jgi:hypothetical protein